MAKNTKKKAKFKPVEFIVSKEKFKNALENILKHKSSTDNYNRLNTVLFQTFKPDNLTMVATDGNTLLRVELPIEELTGEARIILNGTRLKKLKILKDFESNKRGYALNDNLKIVIWEDSITIHDLRNSIQYGVPEAFVQEYPDYEKLIPKNFKDFHRIGLNMALLSKFSGLANSMGVPIKLYITPGDETAGIHLESEYDCVKYSGVLMPCIIRE